jgi:hypothetical protein
MIASIHSAFSMIPLHDFVPPHLVDRLDSMLSQLETDNAHPGLQKLLKIQRRWLKDRNRGQLE